MSLLYIHRGAAGYVSLVTAAIYIAHNLSVATYCNNSRSIGMVGCVTYRACITAAINVTCSLYQIIFNESAYYTTSYTTSCNSESNRIAYSTKVIQRYLCVEVVLASTFSAAGEPVERLFPPTDVS